MNRSAALTLCGLSLAVGLATGVAVRTAPTASAQSPASGVIATLPASTTGVGVAATRYQVDAVHSSTVFRISHLGLADFWGRFNSISGNYAFDPSDLEGSSFAIDIATESVDTNNSRRDGHLKSPDFFNAKEHPTIEFRSTKITPDEETDEANDYVLEGELKMHGVAKRIRAKLDWNGAKDTPQGFKSGASATFVVKRTDFGMDSYVENGMLGDRVRIFVALEGVRQDG